MGLIFEECKDPYGLCIRQFTMFGLSLLVFFLSAYSLYRTRRLQKKISLEHLPLVVNFLTAMILISLYVQQEYYSTSILMLAIEIYTYCLLTFTVVFNVLRRVNRRQPIVVLTRAFLVVTVIALVTILVVLILSLTKTFTCARDRGYGTMATILCELVLMAVNYKFGKQYRGMIQQSAYQANTSSSLAEHFLDQQHKAHKIRIRQINMIRAAFLVSIVLNISKIVCILAASHPLQCQQQDNRFVVDSAIDVAILSLENLAQIFPHFMIPLILWYIPAKTRQVADTTLYFSANKESATVDTPHPKRRFDSSLANDLKREDLFRQRLHSPEREAGRP